MKCAPEGIVAGPLTEDNMYLWEASIQYPHFGLIFFRGPAGTPFEGGVFNAILEFPKDYPLSPPKMRFTSKIYHPNSNPFPVNW